MSSSLFDDLEEAPEPAPEPKKKPAKKAPAKPAEVVPEVAAGRVAAGDETEPAQEPEPAFAPTAEETASAAGSPDAADEEPLEESALTPAREPVADAAPPQTEAPAAEPAAVVELIAPAPGRRLRPPEAAERIRLFHFADVHLGVETYGKYNPETGLNTRLEDFTASLNQAVDRALEADIDLAVFAGDAYKARDPNQTHQRAFAAALKRLTDNDVPVALLVGNHDIPNTRGRAHALEIYGLLGGAGVTIFQHPRTETIRTRRGEVRVAGMPYLTRSRVIAQEEARGKTVEDVAQLIRDKYIQYVAQLADEAKAYPGHIAILTGHFTIQDARVGVQGFLNNPNEPQVPATSIAHPVFDYVAMGHVHKHQEMNRGQEPPVLYSGSIDRIDFGERTEQKGFLLADLEKGKRPDWRFVPLDTRRFLNIEADAGDSEDPTLAIIAQIEKHPLPGSVVRVSYRVPNDRAALVRTEDIRKALAPAHLVVALQRDMPTADALVRSQALTESVTPESALTMYLELQPRLAARKDDLLAAARPLLDFLEQEAALR